MKIRDKGYWVSKLFYIRSWIHWLFSSIRFGSITFFSAINPALHLGGMLDDRKSDMYDMIPGSYLPFTLVTKANHNSIPDLITSNNLKYPLIVKPNIGYKGYMVKRVENASELEEVMKEYNDKEVLIQEFLNHKKEFSLLFYRLPHSKEYGITSFVEKVLPFVIGDGTSTLESLIEKNASAFLDKEYVLSKRSQDLKRVVPNGEKVIIDHVGNYSRGSKFYTKNDEIDQDLISTGNNFFYHLKGINFGRIDLKADSITDVKEGNFKILEINGAKSEPLHIYDPSISWGKIWQVISEHWSIINQIAREQLSGNFHLPSAKDGIDAARTLKRLTTN